MKKISRKLCLHRETVQTLTTDLRPAQGGLAPAQYQDTVWRGRRYSDTCSEGCSYSICEWC